MLASSMGDDMWPPNRWYGLFVPGKLGTTFDTLRSPLKAAPSVAGWFLRLDTFIDPVTLTAFDQRGVTPFFTLEPWMSGMKPYVFDPAFSLAALNTGSQDTRLRRLAAAMRDYDKTVYLRLAHEMNGHWYPWAVGQNGNTAEQYIAFWKRVRDIFTIAPKIRWVFSSASINGLRLSAPPIAAVYPGDDLVDFAGTTGYGWDLSAEVTYSRTFAALANISDRPFLIPEMGAQNGLNKVGVSALQWTQSFGPYLRANPRIQGFVWFHIDPSIGATGDYRLLDPDVIASLNQALGDVPITTNGSIAIPDAAVSPEPVRPQLVTPNLNPTTAEYAQDVVKGWACDPKGPKRGFDKYGRAYECWASPEGWYRWKPLF